MSRAIYQDVRLDKSQQNIQMPPHNDTYALQVPVDRVTGVEVVEALGHIQELGCIQFNQLCDVMVHLRG